MTYRSTSYTDRFEELFSWKDQGLLSDAEYLEEYRKLNKACLTYIKNTPERIELEAELIWRGKICQFCLEDLDPDFNWHKAECPAAEGITTYAVDKFTNVL